ncbi:hypothetical protein [Nostoc sp.]|uniref:hypothetical protein n=1 Tax=Nostoc sp. TaxID=1180 RepID=UPI002FF8C2F1
MGIGDWGLGIGDWGLGIRGDGDWAWDIGSAVSLCGALAGRLVRVEYLLEVAVKSYSLPHSPFPIPHSPFPNPHSPFPLTLRNNLS